MITQKQKILDYISKNGSITPAEAFSKLGIYNFSARLSELKEEGYTFEMTWEKSMNEYGEVRFGRYRIVQ